MSYWFVGNHLLVEFDNRKKTLPRTLSMNVGVDPIQVPMGGYFTVTSRILRPDGTSVEKGEVKAFATFSNKSQRSVQMTFSLSERQWSGQIYTSGAVAGDFNVRIFVLEENERWVSRNLAKGKIIPYVLLDTQPLRD